MDHNICVEYQRTILRLKLEKFIWFKLNMDHCPEIEGDVIIYGAGKVGKLLLRCFETKPIAFIDSKQGLKDICGIQVYCMDECPAEILEDNNTVIVTPVWAYDEICGNIAKFSANANVISLEKLVDKL